MFIKYFTPQEANKRLPLVKQITADILSRAKALRAIVEKSQGQEWPPEANVLQEEINEYMRELERLGCFYKDWNFEIGLVDFPAKLNGLEVLLCWKSDEKNIRWYHPLDEGYAGRKLIPENLLEQ